jgi:radical SAM protein with 4Fe4S-binding SPASM domain
VNPFLPPLLLSQETLSKFAKYKIPEKYESELFQETNTETLILVPSERCNLKCKYCYETAKNPLQLNFDDAATTIANTFSQLPDNKKLKIEFRGGEPFLEFPIIKKICTWVFDNYKKDNYFFYAVSNGTCFSDEVKQWLSSHKDRFFVALSIDGDKHTHNANRCNSFDSIDFQFIFNTWDVPYAFTTLLPENANNIFSDLLFLIKNNWTIRANFEIVHTWTNKQLEDLSIGLKKLADYLLQNDIPCHLNLFSRYSFLDYNLDAPSIDKRFFLACNAGLHRKVLTADGSIYPCQTLVPSCFNHHGKEYGEQLFQKLRHEEMNPEKCCKCKFFFLCYICVGFSYSYAKDFKWRNESFCDITRLRAFIAAYYWGNYFEKKEPRSLTIEDLTTISRIVHLYSEESIYANRL